jgi:hypothetical protein
LWQPVLVPAGGLIGSLPTIPVRPGTGRRRTPLRYKDASR